MESMRLMQAFLIILQENKTFFKLIKQPVLKMIPFLAPVQSSEDIVKKLSHRKLTTDK